jgi:hypothetical protein
MIAFYLVWRELVAIVLLFANYGFAPLLLAVNLNAYVVNALEKEVDVSEGFQVHDDINESA